MRLLIPILLLMCMRMALADHASVSFETGSTGAIMTNSATTLEQGQSVAGINLQFLELDDISDSQLEAAGTRDEDLHSVDDLYQLAISFTHGITDNWMAGISLPYIKRGNVREAHNDMGVGEVELAGDSAGLADIRVFTQYRIFARERTNLALLGGLKIPSGEDEERELEGGIFETEQQPGSGSWDPFVGLAYDQAFNGFGLSSHVLYTFANEGAQGTDLGDFLSYNVAAVFRIFSPEGPHEHHRHAHGFNVLDYVDMVLELNGDWRQWVSIDSINDENTGGHILYLSPGIRAGIGHRWSVFTSVGIPVARDLNGIQSEPAYRLVGGVSTRF